MPSRELTFRLRRLSTIALMILFIINSSSSHVSIGWGVITVCAQSSLTTLSGTVLDEAGAVVPAVSITALNLSTALQRHATTNDEGSYVIPLLPPGRYNVTLQRNGFTSVEIRNVILNVNDQLALKVKLKVAEIGETVTVIEDVAGIRDSASVGTTVNRRFVENLPLNGRSFQTLFELTPGVVLTKSSFNEQGQFSVNGQRANANYFMVDGVSANIGVSAGSAPGQSAVGSLPALTALGGTNNLVSVDALEEFHIQTSTYDPEFGRTPGAQVSIVTRSGGNEFRGAAFNYFRNEALDANDWFANSRGLRRTAIRQNDFGGVIGGHIIKDRAFFFFSYEGLRLRQPQVAVTEVPSLGARAAAPAQIKPFLNAYPLPNGLNTRNGFAEFAASYSDPSSLNATSIRVDTIANQKLTLFGRYNYAPSKTVQRGSVVVPGFSVQPVVDPNVALSLNTLSRATLNTQTLTAGANFVINPYVNNDLRVNWSSARGATTFALDDFGGAAPLPSVLLFPQSISPQNAGFQFLLGGGTNSSLQVGKNVDNSQRQVNLINNLSIVKHSHQLKFGVDYRRLAPIYDPAKYNQSIAYKSLTEETGFLPGTALSGAATSVLVFAGADPRHPLFTNFSAYAQDTWRGTPRLTLTYGVRWELNPPPSEKNGNDPLTVQGLDNPVMLTLAPRGTPLWKTTFNNFAPRFGAAYQLATQPGRELVLRGGLGIFYDLGNGQASQGFGSVFPFVAGKSFSYVRFPLDPAQAAPPSLSLNPPYGTIVAFDPKLKLPRTVQWNVALEKSLGSNQIVSASYVASVGHRLLREDALVNPNQNFTLVRVTRNAAESSYHALQIQFARRLSKGLQALASYTWSHSIDDASRDSLSRVGVPSINAQGGVIATNTSRGANRGSSDFDVRHSFTAATTYNLPTPRLSTIGTAFLRNWSIDAILRLRTAAPVNVITRRDVFGEGLILELQRPDLITGVPLYIDDSSAGGGRRINPDAFRIPSGNRQGTLGYNALRGFGVSQLDLAVRRQFNLAEQLNLQLRMEVFNALNHPNFGNQNNNLSSNLFGRSTQMFGRSLGTGGINGGLSPLYQIGGPRSIQLALKLQF